MVSKTREPVPSHVATRLSLRSAGSVSYDRHAYETRGLRVTVDRRVTTGDGREVGFVVIEVKGRAPKWLRRLLPDPRRDFSKRRFVTRKFTA
ncbi:MAG TPA: hypothetical protein VF288_10845 [Mycobacteriales bacterium]